MVWDDIYRDHWASLVKYARRRSVPGTDAEDVAATAMLRVWRQDHPPDSSSEVIRYCLLQTVRWLLKVPPGVSKRGGRSPRTNWGKRVTPPDWHHTPIPKSCENLSDWFPDDLPQECRDVLIKVLVGRMTLKQVGEEYGADEKWAMAVYQRGLYKIANAHGARMGRRRDRSTAHLWT